MKGKVHPNPPRNLRSSKVTHDSVTLSWTYEGANEQTIKVNDETITNVKSPHTLNSLDSNKSYKIQVVTKDGDSNVVTVKTKEYIPVTVEPKTEEVVETDKD